MSKNKIHIIGLAIFSYFMAIEIRYDMGTPEYKADFIMHWYIHLAITLMAISIVLKSLAENFVIKLCWLFFASCAGNWIFRFYLHSPNKLDWHEYMWAAIFLISIPIQYKRNKRTKLKPPSSFE